VRSNEFNNTLPVYSKTLAKFSYSGERVLLGWGGD